MSPASQAPLIYNGRFPKARKSLALGLAKTAASQLDEFVRSRALDFWAKPTPLHRRRLLDRCEGLIIV